MNDDLEETFKQMGLRAEVFKNKMREINTRLKVFYERLQMDRAQQRRNAPAVADEGLSEEFKKFVAEIRVFADESEAFWSESRVSYNNLDKKKFIVDSRILIKQVNAAALEFVKHSESFFIIYRDIQNFCKESSLRLNLWMLEGISQDLSKVNSKILFMTRDMEKYYE